MMRIIELVFAVCMLASASLALQWGGSSTSNVRYDGGSTYPACQGATPVDYFANIAHILTVNATLTQDGQDVDTFASGPANVTVTVATDANIGRIVSISTLNASRTAQPSPAPGNLVFNSAEYKFLSGKYGDANCLSKNPAHGATDRGAYYLNFKYGNSQCDHAMVASDAVTVNIGYNSGIENDGCMTGPYDGMGKGYMYCDVGTVKISGKNAGNFSSSGQTFNGEVNITTGTTSIPVSVTYKCYFVAELYLNDGTKQSLEDAIYAMPSNVPITQTVNVPIVIITPPDINLIPIIRINDSKGIVIDYNRSQTLTTFNRNQKVNLTFLVKRTDDLPIPTTILTWQYIGTPPEIKTSVPVIYINQPLNPPVIGGGPPSILNPPNRIEITICDDDKEFDTITVTIDPFGNIRESIPGDNTITLTINCSNKNNDNFRCSFYPTNNPIIEPGKSIMTLLRCWNGTNGQVDCPTVTSNMVKYYNNDFGNYFIKPVYWAEIKSKGYDSDNFTVTAIENSQPEIAYSGTVEVNMPTDRGEIWRDCRFNVLWRRPDCRYYM